MQHEWFYAISVCYLISKLYYIGIIACFTPYSRIPKHRWRSLQPTSIAHRCTSLACIRSEMCVTVVRVASSSVSITIPVTPLPTLRLQHLDPLAAFSIMVGVITPRQATIFLVLHQRQCAVLTGIIYL